MDTSSPIKLLLLGACATVSLVACCHAIREHAPEAQRPRETRPDAGLTADVHDKGAQDSASPALPALQLVLEDPRLVNVAANVASQAYVIAASALDVARQERQLSLHEACTWSYASGRLHWLAGEFATAAERFDDVAKTDSSDCPLAGYARFRTGDALARLGNAEAEVRLRMVPPELPIKHDADVTLANALYLRGDKKEAIALFEKLLGEKEHVARWGELSAHLASLLAEETQNEASLRRAVDLSTRVLIEVPRSAEALTAGAIRTRAIKALRARGKSLPEKLSPDELARQAKGWADEGDGRRATTAAEAIVRAGSPVGSFALCQALTVIAENAPRPKADDLWTAAIKGCKGREEGAVPLYRGARSSLSNHRPAEAIARFAEVERTFPKHRLADDARLRRAMIELDAGKTETALSLLDTVSSTYPEGDMGADAEFRAGLLRFTRGEFEKASLSFDRSVAANQKDRHWASAGRSAYFRARTALAQNNREEAVERLVSVIRTYPLTYSMVIAWNRLRAIDPEAARASLATIDREDSTTAPFRIADGIADARVARFVALLESGDRDGARAESNAIDAMSEENSAVPWLVGHYYNEAHLPETGHTVGRTRFDYLAAGPKGEWRLAWETAFPRVFPDDVTEAARATGMNSALIWAIMREESAFKTDAKSGANAHGLMQLIPSTARLVAKDTRWPGDLAALDRADVSIALGARVLAATAHSLPQLPFVIASYNAGEGPTRRWLSQATAGTEMDVWVEQIPYEETRGYVKRVIATMAAYAFLYDRGHFEETVTLPLSLHDP